MPDHQNSSAGSEGAIKQRFDGEEQRKDCFLCSAAMAAGVIYDEAWNALDDELRACFAADAKGPIGDQCDRVLAALGFERVRVGARTGDPTTAPGDYFVLFMLPEYATSGFLRNILWGRRALLQVPSKNYPGEQHIIYWDGRELHDPSNKRTWEWKEVEPIYVWLFDERRVIPTPAQAAVVPDPFNRKQVEAVCRAVCNVEGLDPDDAEWTAGGDPPWTRYADAVASALASQPSPAATVNKKTRCESCNLLEPCADPQCPNSLTRSSAGNADDALAERFTDYCFDTTATPSWSAVYQNMLSLIEHIRAVPQAVPVTLRRHAIEAADAIKILNGHDSNANLRARYGERWWEEIERIECALRSCSVTRPEHS